MIWLILSLVGMLVVMAVIIYALATRRIAGSLGQPTPDEAKIEATTKANARAVVEAGEKEKTEVLRDNDGGLLARLRNRVRRK